MMDFKDFTSGFHTPTPESKPQPTAPKKLNPYVADLVAKRQDHLIRVGEVVRHLSSAGQSSDAERQQLTIARAVLFCLGGR